MVQAATKTSIAIPAGPQRSASSKPLKKPPAPDTGKTLAGHVAKTAEGVAKVAAQRGAKLAQAGTKTAISLMLTSTFGPISLLVNSLGPAKIIIQPLTNWLADKLERYIAKNNINLEVSAKEVIEKLVSGHYQELSEDVTNIAGAFINDALDPKIQQALASGNPMKIAKSMGLSLQSLMDTEGAAPSKFFGVDKLFSALGKRIPLINKLPKTFQPWVAGAGTLMFGGFIVRSVIKFFKWAFFLGGITVIGSWAKKLLFSGGGAPHDTHGLDPHQGGKPGMLSTALNIAKMFGGGAPGMAH